MIAIQSLRAARQRGFSLLEILVAVTVLAIAMAVLMQIFSRGVNNADYADRYAKASMLAESMLTTIGVESALAEGETSGDFGDGFSWRASVKLYSSTAEPTAELVNAAPTVDPNSATPGNAGSPTGQMTLGRVGAVGGVGGAGGATSTAANAPAAGAPTLGQTSNLAVANVVDIETLLPVRLYEIELAVVFKTDDGRERMIALNSLKLGPRP